MNKIEIALRSTDKKCSCGGIIVEKFKTFYGEHNGIYGPGGHTPSHVASDGFVCQSCGLSYGEPVFIRTKPTKQEEFELSLQEAVLSRPITLDDLPPKPGFRKGREHQVKIGTSTLNARTMTPTITRPKKIPKELKALKEGTIVYVLPNHHSNEPYDSMRLHQEIIQLTRERNAQRFEILQDCIK